MRSVERLAPLVVAGTTGGVCLVAGLLFIWAFAPDSGAQTSAARLIVLTVLAAILLGIIVGAVLARVSTGPLRRMTAVVGRAARDHAYSLRVDEADGDLGRMSLSINDLLSEMQRREVELRRRTTDLETANRDLEAFAWSVSHDLRAPLASIDGFVQAIETECADTLESKASDYFRWIRVGCGRMRDLVDGLLQMSQLSRAELQREPVDLSGIARGIADWLRRQSPARAVQFEIRDGVHAFGDERLLRAVMENLLSNAWKFTRHRDQARIEFGQDDGAFYVRDNGAGFDPTDAGKMFRPFQRLHPPRDFEGTGIGLATVQKIIERHGGRAWAEGEVEKGATIYFTTA